MCDTCVVNGWMKFAKFVCGINSSIIQLSVCATAILVICRNLICMYRINIERFDHLIEVCCSNERAKLSLIFQKECQLSNTLSGWLNLELPCECGNVLSAKHNTNLKFDSIYTLREMTWNNGKLNLAAKIAINFFMLHTERVWEKIKKISTSR